MPAGKYNIIIEQGADFQLSLVLKQGNNLPYNLTGATGLAQLRLTPESTVVLATFTIEFETPRTDGKIKLSIPAATTSTFTFFKAVYDLYITNSGITKRLLEGDVVLSKAVSR